MSSTNPGQDLERFEAALRQWGAVAPRTTAQQAAARLEGRLQREPRAASTPWLAAAAALIAALALAVLLGGPAGVPNSGTVAVVRQPLPDNVIVSWVDAETPLYFITTPPRSEKGDMS